MPLPTVTIPHAELEITRLGFGCASLMRTTSAAERQRLLGEAFDAGIRHFDVARLYGLGASEGELGRFLRGGRRDEATVATKFGLEPSSGAGALARFQKPARALLNAVPALRKAVKRRDAAFNAPRQYDVDIARRSLDTSLAELGLDHIDLLFVHDPRPHDDVHTDELRAFFEQARAAGKIRAWGVSQDAYPGLDLVDRLGDAAVLQTRSTIFERGNLERSSLTFGVMGAPLEQLSGALRADATLRQEWTNALGSDPLGPGGLGRLLLGDALDVAPGGSVLYTTNRPERLAAAAATVQEPPSAQELAAFRDLVARTPMSARA